MNSFTKQAAQGDLLITKVDEIPCEYEPAKDESGKHVLAHSETGHNHVVDSACVDMYTAANDDFTAYIDVKKPCDVIHLRSFDTHAPISLLDGKYRITRQREYTPEGYRRASD